jgi:hypothetical protein
MNTERIKELLIQSEVFNKDGTVLKDVTGYELNKFAELIVAEEREACALAVEQAGIEGLGTLAAAAVIRKRGNDAVDS